MLNTDHILEDTSTAGIINIALCIKYKHFFLMKLEISEYPHIFLIILFF